MTAQEKIASDQISITPMSVHTGAEISGDPEGLASALYKLHMGAQRIPAHVQPASASLFIVSPLAGGGMQKMFSTHPPMEERIAKLRAMRMVPAR